MIRHLVLICKANLYLYSEMINKIIGSFKSIITFDGDSIAITLIEQNEDVELFTNIKDIPNTLINIVDSIQDLFEVIKDIHQEQIILQNDQIIFSIPVLHKVKDVAFPLSQRISKKAVKSEPNASTVCLTCQEMRERVQRSQMQLQKFKEFKKTEEYIMCQRIKYLEGEIELKNQYISKLEAQAGKTLQEQKMFPPTLKLSFNLSMPHSHYFDINKNIIKLGKGALPKSCQLISDVAIPPTGKHSIIVRYITMNKNSKDSTVCLGILTPDRFKTHSSGGKGEKYSVGFWNRKDDRTEYFTEMFSDKKGQVNGEIYVDGEIVVRSKKLYVAEGEWIRLDIDLQAQQAEFITKEGSIATRKLPKNYEGKPFHFFVRMSDPLDTIEII